MKDIRRRRLVRFSRVWRRFFAIGKASELRPTGIENPWRPGNGGEVNEVLEYDGEI